MLDPEVPVILFAQEKSACSMLMDTFLEVQSSSYHTKFIPIQQTEVENYMILLSQVTWDILKSIPHIYSFSYNVISTQRP